MMKMFPGCILAASLFILCVAGFHRAPDAAGENLRSTASGISFCRGFNIVSWRRGDMQKEQALESLDQLKKEIPGVNSLLWIQSLYMPSLTSSRIGWHDERGSSPEDYRRFSAEARKRGYRILVKVHLESLTGEWRGYIDPVDPGEFFSKYRERLGEIITMIDECGGADMLVFGTELKAIEKKYGKKWQELIAFMREECRKTANCREMRLGYCANWDSFRDVLFWSEVDTPMVSAYFPLCDKEEATLEDLREGFTHYRGRYGAHDWLGELKNLSDRYGKKIMLGEAGYLSAKGCWKEPWSYTGDFVYSGDAQALAYEALLEATGKADFIEGIFLWHWELFPLKDGTGKTTFSPQGKPAMQVLNQYWK